MLFHYLGFGMLKPTPTAVLNDSGPGVSERQHIQGGRSTGRWPVERRNICSSPYQCVTEVHLESLTTGPI